MPLRNEKKQKALTDEQYINWFESLETNEITAGPLTVYWSLKNSCMGCGCPKNNPQMKNSINAYHCLNCIKKMIGEKRYNEMHIKMNEWLDKTQGMTSKEILQTVKKSLIFRG